MATITTSGDRSFEQTRNQIIQDAYEDSGVIGPGDTLGDADLQKGARLLNKMVIAWGARGYNLWLKNEAALFPQQGVAAYQLGNGITGAYCCLGTGFISTTSTATAAAAATTITLATVTGMTVADNIGVQLDAGTRQWFTISSINTGTKVVTLSAGLTSQATSGITVVSFTASIPRPLRITNVRWSNLVSLIDIPIDLISHEDYFELPDKTDQGTMLQVAYTPYLNQGTLWVWQSPVNVQDYLTFTYLDQIQDFVNPSDQADIPQEWLETLTANLAYRIGRAYSQPDLDDLKQFADETFRIATEADNFDGSYMFQLDQRAYYNGG